LDSLHSFFFSFLPFSLWGPLSFLAVSLHPFFQRHCFIGFFHLRPGFNLSLLPPFPPTPTFVLLLRFFYPLISSSLVQPFSRGDVWLADPSGFPLFTGSVTNQVFFPKHDLSPLDLDNLASFFFVSSIQVLSGFANCFCFSIVSLLFVFSLGGLSYFPFPLFTAADPMTFLPSFPFLIVLSTFSFT